MIDFQTLCIVLVAWAVQVPSVTSWWRSKHRNDAVGGQPKSKHLTGQAVDLVWDNPPDLAELSTFLEALGFKLIREKDHDHIERRSNA